MRKKWLKVKCYFFSFLLVLSPFQTIYAENKASDVFQDGFRYSDIIKHLDRFTSKIWVEKEFWGFGSETAYLINSIVQAIFWLNKMIYYVCSGIYKYLSNSSVIDEYVDVAISAGASIYGNLSGSIQKWAIVLMVLYVAYVYFVENGDFFKLILRFLLVYICSVGMFYNYEGKYVLRHAYDNINMVTQEIATSSLNNLSLEGTTSGSSLLSVEKGDAVLEEYFNISVWKPYKYLNSSLAIVGPMGGERTEWSVKEAELKSLLDYDSGNDAFRIVKADGTQEKIGEFVGKGDSIKQKMLSAHFGDKFMYALASIFDSFVLGIILDGFAVMSFSMSLLFLLLCLLSGAIALISLIPTFENALMNFWKRAFGVLMVSGLGSILSLFVLWFYDLLSGILETAFFGNMFLAVIAKVVIFWYMWKKRDLILSILTANRVTQLSNRFTRRLSAYGNRFSRRMTKNAMSRLGSVKRVAGRITTKSRRFLAERGLNRVRSKISSFNPLNKERKNSVSNQRQANVSSAHRNRVKGRVNGKKVKFSSRFSSQHNSRFRANPSALKKLTFSSNRPKKPSFRKEIQRRKASESRSVKKAIPKKERLRDSNGPIIEERKYKPIFRKK